ncbi:MAG: hypothetical protein A2452_12350 [Candidatus Firestonebacteria bacterium RIFOXYC2_FULL_39_67]|nr:MAG: hypothetical protein A2536_07880 [Candidatus Firestonebacteria bacterium RIFOXYD2_FULL_39_29]OGF55638.1 MAG: hypothetical protein A2452_12350 [Candidatus Firestonebacteria bacterium RIFOXYC2_FULL_39_67]OGF57561.1 MAG: hypothetical protein A2497_01310 [Candidatus Firestonebacteria bacterium RifOxyC12_full_39_7]
MRISKGKCEEIRRKIPAFVDGELSDVEKSQVKEHLDSCLPCLKESKIYLKQDKILTKLKDIESSLNFNRKLFLKIQQADSKGQNPMDIFLKWILPVPALCAAILVIFMGFTLVSPYIYALPGEKVNTTVTTDSRKSFFSFVEFSSYCDKHCEQVCRYCRVAMGSECKCGRCSNESKN